MVLTAFAEVLSIGAVLPFLGVLTAPDRIFASPFAQTITHIFGAKDQEHFLLLLTIAFGLAALLAGSMRLLLLWASTRISVEAGVDLSSNVYLRTLYQPYAVHVTRNSSEFINGISGKADSVIYGTIMPILTLIGSSVMLIIILVALLLVDPVMAIAAYGGFGMIYAIVIRLTRDRLIMNSQIGARETTFVLKALQEGLGGIRDVLIDGTQGLYCRIYRNANYHMRRAHGNSLFIGASPRFAMEALGMLLIATLALILAQQENGIANAIPILGTLALGAQRLLPVLQQGYHAWSTIRSGQVSLQDILELLDNPLPKYAGQLPAPPIPFMHQICLKKISFRYSSELPWVVQGLNLTIAKGSRVGLIGKTGSGKSTILDIVMSLLQSTEGTLEIDGHPITAANCRSWQAHIAHVPQAIFLADCTIEENIAFGVNTDKIDRVRVRKAAQQAQIADIIETWPEQYRTFVGERGIRLSGGQRQRIGIARALYKKADVIIFDEATSALDNETEQAVMEAIECLSDDLTLLIVAHRLTTLKNCTQIVELGSGSVKRIGTYKEIVERTA